LPSNYMVWDGARSCWESLKGRRGTNNCRRISPRPTTKSELASKQSSKREWGREAVIQKQNYPKKRAYRGRRGAAAGGNGKIRKTLESLNVIGASKGCD